VLTDERRVQQVLKNLLSNAFKFTEAGSVRLTAGPAPAGLRAHSPRLRAAPAVLALSVSDTGIGIESDKLMVIFEAFQQADGTTSRRYGGTGLGLSISREIASLLGGEIRVISEPGAGSTFTLLLPTAVEPAALPGAAQPVAVPVTLAAGQRPRASLAAPPANTISPPLAPGWSDARHQAGYAAAADLRGRRVLLVDDDVRNVYALTSMLEDRGMEVLSAPDGERGIETLEANPDIELVLMDIMMPGMDGFGAIRAIRRLGSFAELPIIALTAKAMRGDREKTLAAGASDYITKPVDLDQLLDLMRLWLSR
jgi:CheY-like chemotaxis protein